MISPFPPHPVKRPLMLQRWEQLTFVHWRCKPELIQELLPAGLTIDTHDGAAWIGLVPFVVRGLRPPGLPALPWLSSFPETNVRTYVVGPDGERGIWFFSLDAARLPAVLAARASYRLPYRWAHMRVEQERDTIRYWSERREKEQARVNLSVKAGAMIPAAELGEREHFLTARFRLYTKFGERLAAAQVEHPPWQLHRANILRLQQTATAAAGITLPPQSPLVHYSPGVLARIGAPHII